MTRTFHRFFLVSASVLAFALAFAGPALATDPDHVNFTLEGCRLPVGATLPSNVVCDDSQYTTGNLGKSWNELDLVPYRLTANSGGPEQTYTMAVALDGEDAGKPGYDLISVPVLNTAHSTSAAGCLLTAVSDEKIMSPGLGGIDETRYRELTIHQAAGATCVWDYYGRLAIGSHLFPGSSLHANKALVADSDTITVSGIGASDVSIPVKEIAPQELSKDMSASQGSAYSWGITKEATPTDLNFGNTCRTSDEARTATVQVVITWTRNSPSANGDITVTTHVYAKNPAARTITVNVNDKIYAGSDQSNLIGTANSGDVDIAANSTKLVMTDTRTVANGTATSFNDVATATYIDKLTGIPVTGTTQATASANVQVSNNPLSATAEIRDTESITGDGLSFSTELPTGTAGSFTNGYTTGDHTTGPVEWSSGTVSSSGSATFTKTVYLDQPRATSGTLSDTASVFVTGDLGASGTASASTDISSTLFCTTASLEIVKTGSPDVVHDGDPVTFTYAVTNPGSNTGSLTDVTVSDDKCSPVEAVESSGFNVGDSNQDGELDPGETWTFTCTTTAKHADEDAHGVITNVATASGTDQYGDTHSDTDDDTTKVIHPAIKIDKTGPATAEAGQKISYVLTVTNPGDTPLGGDTLKVVDAQCNGDPVTLIGKGGDATPNSFDPGDVWTYSCSLQTAVGDTSVENHATAQGTDQLGQVVSSASVVTATLTQPEQLVLPERIPAASARLLGPTGCVAKAFNARIRGVNVATVTFVLDGKVIKKVNNTKRASVILARINPAKLKLGVHRLVANVTFRAETKKKPTSLRLSFQRCGKKLVAPRFTG